MIILNDAKGYDKNIKRIKDEAVDYKDFIFILLQLKIQNVRLPYNIVKILENYMSCIPLKKFWKHVILLRTRSDTSNKKFEGNKKKQKELY